ncbi:hypothetical protein L1987_52361 [Smallanthus sonchifolius]|uniref:Uncharacterized protein n=1 Tax=Smallanthus sonchifolius TaxID=185202 RepID=A0ACB9ETI7_9ASTR|nr:hypothetical protein L1987_52361 [Smallanthus sonchifolius]
MHIIQFFLTAIFFVLGKDRLLQFLVPTQLHNKMAMASGTELKISSGGGGNRMMEEISSSSMASRNDSSDYMKASHVGA